MLLSCWVAVLLSCWGAVLLEGGKPKQTDKKSAEKTAKFDPKWGQGRPKIDKKIGKTRKDAQKRYKWLPDGSQDPFTQKPPWIFTIFWVPSGTPTSAENSVFSKNGVTGTVRLSIFLSLLFFLTFCFDLGQFLEGPTLKK